MSAIQKLDVLCSLEHLIQEDVISELCSLMQARRPGAVEGIDADALADQPESVVDLADLD